ncbi:MULTISPECIES: hypothetical protein [unclassified Moorena]|nr:MULTISPECIES: hypothetical protein [unclassified Moorena]
MIVFASIIVHYSLFPVPCSRQLPGSLVIITSTEDPYLFPY